MSLRYQPGKDLATRMAEVLPGVHLNRQERRRIQGIANRTAEDLVQTNASAHSLAEKMRKVGELYDLGQEIAGDDPGKQQAIAAILAEYVRGPNILGWQV